MEECELPQIKAMQSRNKDYIAFLYLSGYSCQDAIFIVKLAKLHLD